jgi:hypothetical protein
MSVVQDWLGECCSLKQQTVLLSALRGCDGIAKEDISKTLTRALRGTLLHSAHHGSPEKPGTFMSTANVDLEKAAEKFVAHLDHYPVHWVFHFAHACEIVGHKHPHPNTGMFWMWIYHKMCEALHVNPETEKQCDWRLRDIYEEEAVA